MIHIPPSLPRFQRGCGRKWQAKLVIWIGSSGYGLSNAVAHLTFPEPPMIPTTIPPRVLDTLRTDVRAGRSCEVFALSGPDAAHRLHRGARCGEEDPRAIRCWSQVLVFDVLL